VFQLAAHVLYLIGSHAFLYGRSARRFDTLDTGTLVVKYV
jgi:hypothetical protein